MASVPSCLEVTALANRFRRRAMRLMRVSVYRAEGEQGLLELSGHGESAYGLKLRCLARREIMCACEETAAILVYREVVGHHRQARLRELKAPETIVAAEMDVNQIAAKLVSTVLLDGITFLLDNQAEAWLIRVEWSDESNDADRQGG